MPYLPLTEVLDQALGVIAQGCSLNASAGGFPEHELVLPPLLQIGAQLYSLADEYELVALPMVAPVDWATLLQPNSAAASVDAP